MTELGPFKSKSGKRYIGIFYADNTVEVLGPMQDAGGMAPRVFEDTATSEEDARNKIKEAISQGIIK
ncbi:MAG: hypothetical protein NTY86_19770 [Deltaproteobacteria bacterium]|nr:hypothetical protein [Deltaproteobacteria bacterium]